MNNLRSHAACNRVECSQECRGYHRVTRHLVEEYAIEGKKHNFLSGYIAQTFEGALVSAHVVLGTCLRLFLIVKAR